MSSKNEGKIEFSDTTEFTVNTLLLKELNNLVFLKPGCVIKSSGGVFEVYCTWAPSP